MLCKLVPAVKKVEAACVGYGACMAFPKLFCCFPTLAFKYIELDEVFVEGRCYICTKKEICIRIAIHSFRGMPQ